MQLHESGENYLETILVLKNRQGYVRSIDIANELGFSKPSISRAMGILKKGGMIEVEPSGNILLTQAGQDKAEAVYERHRLITRFLELTLKLDTDTADTDACRIEHIISNTTFQALKEYVQENDK